MLENSESPKTEEPRPRRVLVVEDDEGLNSLAQKALGEAGYDTESVSNGAEAIECVMANPEVVLLLDIKLPDMTGGEVISALIERNCPVPFIVMTGHGDERMAVKMMKLGAGDYLVKGLDLIERLPSAFQRLFHELDTECRLRATEEALAESERKYRGLYKDTPVMLHSIDQQGKLISVSNQWLKTFGFERDEVLGKKSTDFLTEESREYAQTVLLPEFFKVGDCIDVPFQMVKKGGEVIDVLLSAISEKNEEGEVVHSLAVITDITERKRSEEALRESEERFRNLVETSQDLIWSCDAKGRFTYLNPAWKKLLGYELTEMFGHTSSEFKPPEIAKQDLQTFNRTLKGETTFGYETVYISKSGQHKHLVFSARVLRDSKGKILGSQGTAHDITERKSAEAALRKSEAKYRMIAETASDVIITINEESEILFVNRAAENIFGYAIEEMLGQSLTILMPNLLNIKPKSAWKQYLSNGRKRIAWSAVERSGLHKSGKELFLEVSFNEFEEDGRRYFTGILRDITQQKAAEAEILRIQKLESLGILAGGLAHDFNNFLTTILMNISSARLTAKRNAKVQEVLKAAEHAIDRAKAITRQLSTFTRGGKTMKDTVYLTPLLKESVQFALHGTRVMPEFHLEDGLSPVHIDSGQIDQVINNLVINAMQAMPRGGRLMISASNVTFKRKAPPGPLKAGKYVEVDVQDTGVGILPENIGKIFDPYFTSKKEGTGLGLFSCFSILNQHQGWITVESELGQGSTFTFYLPAASEPAPTDSRPVAGS